MPFALASRASELGPVAAPRLCPKEQARVAAPAASRLRRFIVMAWSPIAYQSSRRGRGAARRSQRNLERAYRSGRVAHVACRAVAPAIPDARRAGLGGQANRFGANTCRYAAA